MDWLSYGLIAFAVLLIAQRFLPVKGLIDLSAQEVAEKLKTPQAYQFIDVREVHEYRRGHIKGFRNIPLSQLPARLGELNHDRPVILICQSGMRSRQAAKLLRQNGFQHISHLKYGMAGWKKT